MKNYLLLNPLTILAIKLLFLLLIGLGCGGEGESPPATAETQVGQAAESEATATAENTPTAAAQVQPEPAPSVTAPAEPAAPAEASPDLSPLIGLHEFAEGDGSDILTYGFNVYQSPEGWQAHIDVNGLQTMHRLLAYGQPSQQGIDFYLSGYRQGNVQEPFAPDEYLLSLELWDGQVWIYWGAIQPQFVSPEDGYSLMNNGQVEVVAGAAGQNDGQTPSAGVPTLADSTFYLVPGTWQDVDGNGQADFWSDSGGVGTRATTSEGLGAANYDDLTLAGCAAYKYYGDIPFDPNHPNAYCFVTDQGYLGKFRVLNRDDAGGLQIQYTIWGDLAAPPSLDALDFEPAGQPGPGSARPWP